jgi:hypothetical protein
MTLVVISQITRLRCLLPRLEIFLPIYLPGLVESRIEARHGNQLLVFFPAGFNAPLEFLTGSTHYCFIEIRRMVR